MPTLLREIETFIEQHGLSESQFGVDALNDKNLVADLRGERRTRPRRLWPETEQTVRDFMAEYREQDAAA